MARGWPILISCGVKEIFDEVLGDKPHQKERMREDVDAKAYQLIDFTIPGGQITEAGLRLNINVALQDVAGVAARHRRSGDLQT